MIKKRKIISPVITLLIISVFLSSSIQAISPNNQEFEPTPFLKDLPKKVIQTEEFTPSLLNEDFGSQNTFWVWPGGWEAAVQYQINATLLAEGEWCHVYLDNATIARWGEPSSISICNQVRDDFDTITYPIGVATAGHPNGTLGDIDGDPKVTILIIDDENYGGYMNMKDDNPDSPFGSNSHSNNREIVYVYSRITPDLDYYSAVICHEFNHIIWFNNDIFGDMTTLYEGSAQHSTYYSGYLSYENSETSVNSLNRHWFTDYFSNHSEQSVLYWNRDSEELRFANYGEAEMFIFYLAEKYGEEVISALMADDLDGPVGIETVLADAGYEITFNDLFLDWIIACALDDESIASGLYCFENTNFTIEEITTIDTLPFSKDKFVHQLYGFDIKKLIAPPDNFTLTYTNPYSYAYLSRNSLGMSIVIKDDNGWNVTQILETETSGNITTFFSGDNIEFAYIITSMMKNSTPTNYATGYSQEAPYKLLGYSLKEGHIPPVVPTSADAYFFWSLTGFLLFMSSLILIRRRKKS